MRPLAPLIDSLLEDLRTGVKEKRSDLQNLWPEIAGPTFSPHTKPTLGQEGLLCVWVDSSVLASELTQRYQGTLLKRTQEALGEEMVREIKFRVGQIR